MTEPYRLKVPTNSNTEGIAASYPHFWVGTRQGQVSAQDFLGIAATNSSTNFNAPNDTAIGGMPGGIALVMTVSTSSRVAPLTSIGVRLHRGVAGELTRLYLPLAIGCNRLSARRVL
jgi:hypothetical protein